MTLIPGTNVGAPIVPYDTADSYPSHLALYGQGGLRTVATIVARDLIPGARLQEGMEVYVQADQNTYKLLPGYSVPPIGADWVVVSGSGSTFINAAPTTIAVGGIPLGSTFPVAQTLQQMFDALLYPYTAPTVSLVLNPSAGTREIGTSIATPILTPTTVRHSNPITTLTLSRSGTGLIYTYPSPAPGGATEPPYTDVSGAVTSNTTYTATVGDGTSTSTGTASYSFLPGIYHGVANSVINTGAGIISAFGSSVVLASSRAVTYTFDASVGGGSNYLYISYPTSFGTPSSTIFNGFTFTDYTTTTVSLTNASGYTQNYYILRTNPTYSGASITWQIL